MNDAQGREDYQYGYNDDGSRSYLEHDQTDVSDFLYRYTFYDANDVATHYYGKNDDGSDFYYDL